MITSHRQSGHGRRVAQAHYAIDGAFLHQLGPELITAFEQASVAWHRLWQLKSSGSGRVSTAGSPRQGSSQELSSQPSSRAAVSRQASQELSSQLGKRACIKSQQLGSQQLSQAGKCIDRALVGLRRIFQDPNCQPRSEGQAAALQLVHNPSPTVPLIVVLPTSSGKSALFYSVAAMTSQQTVIVVVPFAALVDDIIIRGRAAGLQCEEWKDERSGHELQQLIVVSADRAVQGEFKHYAQGLALSGQLAHMFFDECHVAFTDTSYRERLRQLWTLRYLECPFTCLTATLMVQLEEVLKERLSIPNAVVFRRSTARRTIRYQVIDSKNEAASVVASRFIQELPALKDKQRGVVYVRSYRTGKMMSEALQCPFYKAKADDKSEILQAWMHSSGWIVATGALGTGINIEGIIYVVHVDRPYGLTSFVQQSGRSGRNGEISESIIIVRVHQTSGYRRQEILSAYSVEAVDEEAMTAFIQARTCRRRVLSQYIDGETEGTDCHSTDSVFCDWCKVRSRRAQQGQGQEEKEEEEEEEEEEVEQAEQQPSGPQIIGQRLRGEQELYESMIKVMDDLQGQCIYCTTMIEEQRPLHTYSECTEAVADGCGYNAYQQWRSGVDFGQAKQCWECGLSQRICRRLERPAGQWLPCEYAGIMLPSIFIVQQQQHLAKIVQAVGFQGMYDSDDLWEWLNETAEGFGAEWSSNWMKTWMFICKIYTDTARAEGKGVGV